MKDFYKYLQVSQDYLFRELVVVNAGHTMIPPGSDYPATSHPSHHYFRFTQGRVIDECQFDQKVNLEEIAGQLHISYVWFRTYFRKHTGFSPYDYLLNIRINHASLLLANSNLSIKEIALASGFHSQQQFSKTFRNKTGVSPREYKRHFLNGRHADRSRFEFSQ